MEQQNIQEMIMTKANCDAEKFAEKYNAYMIAKMEFESLFEPVKKAIIDAHTYNSDIQNTMNLGGVKLTYVSPSTRTTIDSKKLKEEEPELAKKFTKITNVSATVRVDSI